MTSSKLEKIFIETEGGSIYTLKYISPGSTKVVDVKRIIKTLIGIPITKQEIMIVGGDFNTLKDSSYLKAYRISNETILKVFRVD